MQNDRALWWTLRVGAALCFIGHGAFGIITKEAWVPFFGLVGIGREAAFTLMPLVGTVDILAGCLLLVRPVPVVLLYMTTWALWTAALRPLTGDSVFEMLERAGNYGVPLAMLLMCAPITGWRGWLSAAEPRRLTGARERIVRSVLVATAVLLLVGHGGLGVIGKAGLTAHYAALGLGGGAASAATPLIGWAELLLAATLLLRPSAGVAALAVAWKLATESLWLVDGSPVWEFVERAGSYAAPLAVAIVAVRGPRSAVRAKADRVEATSARVLARAAAVVLLAAGCSTATPVAALGQEHRHEAPTTRQWTQLDDASLLTALRAGGLVLACRHGITESGKDDTGSDRASQRNLSEEGVRHATAIGRAVRAAGIPIGPVLSSTMYRTKETAELAFGDSVVLTELLLRGQRPLDELTKLYNEPPPAGTNRVLMTHQGPLYRVLTMFRSPEIREGDCVVVRPRGDAPFEVLGKLGLPDWERLAAR
jgi:phosphohistidine phosphatase SixA